MSALMAARKKAPKNPQAKRQAAAERKAKRKAKAKRMGRKPTHSALVKKADALFGAVVRSVGRCESGRPNHAGPLQCAHLFSRRYEATRWTRANATCLCAGCHVFFTHRPLEWDEWMRARLGPGYEPLRRMALDGGKLDMVGVLEDLRGERAA